MSAHWAIICKYQKNPDHSQQDEDLRTVLRVFIDADRLSLEQVVLAGTAFSAVVNDHDKVLATVDKNRKDLIKVALLYGVVCYVKVKSLVVENRSDEGRIRQIFSFVTEIIKSHEFAYYKLKVLLHLAKNLKILNYDASEQLRFLKDVEYLFNHCKFFSFIVSHIEAHEPGVSDLSKDALKAWITVFANGSAKCELAEQIYKDTVSKVTWNSRSRYILTAVTIPYVEVRQALLQINALHAKGICTRLFSALEDNLLASVAAELHLSLLKTWGEEPWKAVLCDKFFLALVSCNEVKFDNAVNLFLPPVLDIIDGSADHLLGAWLDRENPAHWLAICSILKLAREKDKLTQLTQEVADCLIPKCLEYSDDMVRVKAFGYFIHARKKTEPFSDLELRRILSFMEDNLNSDHAPFRNNLLSSTKLVIARVVESALSAMKLKKETYVISAIGFLDALVNMLFENLQPGGNYQRFSTSLEILNIVLTMLFADISLTQLSKGSVLTNRPLLVSFAQNLGKFQFFGANHFEILIRCCQVTYSDVRDKSAKILATFFGPEPEQLKDCSDLGVVMCNSPRFAESECGAVFARLKALWLLKSVEEEYIDFVKQLIERANEHFAGLKEDFLSCARSAALQGTILALRRVICECAVSDNVAKVNWKQLVEFVDSVVDFMLAQLACKAAGPKDVPPSFEEMGDSVAEIIRTSSGAANEAAVERAEIEENIELIEISDDQSTVLACAWLNLKESAMLAAYLVETFSNQMTAEECEKCGDIIIRVMTRCRHKGAIEAGAVACAVFCRALSGHENRELQNIPFKQLRFVLDLLETSATSASVTRRSAGLALVVLKIVSSGDKNSKRRHVRYALDRLIRISEKEVLTSDLSTDMVQAQALHITKSLVEDASMAAEIYPFCARLFQLCVEQFSSEFWTIRNASLQLFGGLVLRLVGQKKENEHGTTSVTTFDFFYRNPEIGELIFGKLLEIGKTPEKPNQSLVPLLTLLARLSPGFETTLDSKLTTTLRQFLGHVEYKVRQLAARALSSFDRYYDVPTAVLRECGNLRKILDNSKRKMNLAHGHSLYILYLTKRFVDLEVMPHARYERNQSVIQEMESLRTTYAQLDANLPFMVRLELCKIYTTLEIPVLFNIAEVLKQEESSRFEPGFSMRLSLLVGNYLKFASDNQAATFIKQYSGKRDVILVWLESMRLRLPKMAKSSIAAAQAVDSLMCLMRENERDCDIVTKVLEILEIRGLEFVVKEPDLHNELAKFLLNVTHIPNPECAGAGLRVFGAFVRKLAETGLSPEKEHCEAFGCRVWMFSHPGCAFILRLSAARMLASVSAGLPASVIDTETIGLVRAAIVLLHDDAREVRLEATKAVKSFLREKFEKSPRLAVMALLRVVRNKLGNEFPVFVEGMVTDLKMAAGISDVKCLFAAEPTNPYLEVHIFEKMCQSL